MALGVLYYAEQRLQLLGGTSILTRVELLEEGFVGSATQINGVYPLWRLNFEPADRKEILSGYIQKGRLEADLELSRSELKRIATSDDKQFQLRLKFDGSVKWTGFVVGDKTQINSSDLPVTGTITAKDFPLLENVDYNTFSSDSNKRYIITLADILVDADLGMGIDVYADWTANDLSATDDYFNQTYINEFHLQDFSSFQEGSYAPISKAQALQELIPPGFVLRQWNDKWNLVDLSHLAKDQGSVKRWEYDTAGAQTGSTDPVNLVFDADSNGKIFNITEQPWPGIKELSLQYNHKTSIQNILFENEYVVSGNSVTEFGKEDIKVFDGTRRVVRLSGAVEVTTDTNPGSIRTGDADIIIQIEDLELSLSDGSWDTGNGVQQVSVSGSDTTLTGSFFIVSDAIPSGGVDEINESTLNIEMRWATVSGENVRQVKWDNMSLEIINANAVADSATQNFRLKQSGDYTVRHTVKPVIFGQGPSEVQTALSRSAIRWLDAGRFKALTNFKHDGGSAEDYERFVLDNILNMQRVHTDAMDSDVIANWNPLQIFLFDGDYWFFTGGELNGADSGWPLRIVRLSWNTAGDDTLTESFKVQGSDAGTTIPPSSGEGSSTSDFDARYLEEDKNLSDLDDVSTAQTNLKLKDQTADLNLNSISINGTNLFPDNDPQNLGIADDVTFNQIIANGVLDVNISGGGINQRWDRTDTGQTWFLNHVANRWSLYNTGGNDVTIGLNTASVDQGNSLGIGAGSGAYRLNVNGDTNLSGTLTINTTQLFTLGKEQNLSDDANVSFKEVDIGANWKIDSEAEGGIERLRLQALGANDGAELFLQAKGSANLARITLTPDSSSVNYSFVTLESNGTSQIIDSGAEGTETTLPLSIRIDGTEALGIATDRNITTHGNIADDGFTSGWQGTNYQITSTGEIEAESMFLRGGLTVNELILNRLHYQDGGLIIGAGGGKVAWVTGSAGLETVTFEDPEGNTNLPFSVGAIIMLQEFDLDRTTVVKKVVREVSSIVGSDITLTTTTGWGTIDDTGSIAAGDEMVAIGHVSNTDRDAFLYMSAVDQNNPFLRIMDGVDSYDKFTLGSQTGLKVQLGNLNGLAGFTSNIFGLYAKDNVVIELDSANMKIGKDVGGSNEDGIHIDINDFWYTDGTGSVGNGILNWDASIPEVNLAGFSANNVRLVKENIYGGGTSELVNLGSFSTDREGLVVNDIKNIINVVFRQGSGPEISSFNKVTSQFLFRLGHTNEIAGIDFNDSALSTGDGSLGAYTAGTVTGLQKRSSATTRVFYSGADDNAGTNANFFVRADGKVDYATLGTTVYSRFEEAAFTTNASTSGIDNQFYDSRVTKSGDGFNSVRDTKIESSFIKRFGEDNLIVAGIARIDGTAANGGAGEVIEREGRIYAEVFNAESGLSISEDFATITNTTDQQFTLTLDISSVTNGNLITLKIDAYADINVTNNDGDTDDTDIFLREDVHGRTTS